MKVIVSNHFEEKIRLLFVRANAKLHVCLMLLPGTHTYLRE